MSVTISDIARAANTTHATVSRALRDNPRISCVTRQRIKQVAFDLGYSPNNIARALVTGRMNRIAFWSPSMHERFFHEVSCCFHRILQNDKYEMMVGEFGPQMIDPANAMGLTRMDVDGVLMWGGNLGELKPIMDRKFPAKAPIVNIGCAAYDGMLDFIHVDIYAPAVELMKYLLGFGGSRIAFVSPLETQCDAYGRFRAYNEAVVDKNITPEYITTKDASRVSAYIKVKKYIATNRCPDALFCLNDEIALGAYRALRELGIKIPQEVTLAGCDGIEDLEYVDVPISTILQPKEEICDLAWQFLKNRMQNPDIPQQTMRVNAKFIAR